MLTPSLQKHFEFKIVKHQLLKGNFQHHFGRFNLSTGKAAESSEQNIREVAGGESLFAAVWLLC